MIWHFTSLQNFLVRSTGKEIIPQTSNYDNYEQTNDDGHKDDLSWVILDNSHHLNTLPLEGLNLFHEFIQLKIRELRRLFKSGQSSVLITLEQSMFIPLLIEFNQ